MKSLKPFLIMLFMVIPLMAVAAEPEVKKARTVDELAAMYDVSSCKKCHAKIFEEWGKSIHSRSLIGSGRTVGGVQGAIKNWISFEHSGVKEAKDVTVSHWATTCFKCHLPQIEGRRRMLCKAARSCAVPFLEASGPAPSRAPPRSDCGHAPSLHPKR